jgi:hypothetical protein
MACEGIPLEFRFPVGWEKSPREHPFDLQCISADRYAVSGAWVWNRENLAADVSPQDLFQAQIEDIRSKRKNFQIIVDQSIVNLEGKRLTSLVASGEKGPNRSYYRFTLIEFPGRSQIFAVALQTTLPSEWDTYRPVLEEITLSARLGGESE